MADRLLLATPLERRKVIEEAAKVKHFQIKKEKSRQKLESARNNLDKIRALLHEIEPHLKNLERSAKKKIREKELATELEQISKKYFGVLWQSMEKKIAESSNARTLLQKSIAEIDTIIIQKRSALEDAKKKAAPHVNIGNYQKDLERIRAEESLLLKNLSRIQGEIGVTKEKIRFQVAMSTEKADIPYVKKKIESLIAEIDEVLNSSGESVHPQKVRKLREAVMRLREEISRGVVKKDNQQVIKKLEEIISINEKEILELEKSLQKLDWQRKEVNNEIKQKNKNSEIEAARLHKLEQEFAQKATDRDILRERLNRIEIELAKADVEEKNLRGRIIQTMRLAPEKINYKGPIDIDLSGMSEKIERLSRQVSLCSAIEDEVLQEYQETKERHDFLVKESGDLQSAIQSLQKIIREMEVKIESRFVKTYAEINKNFESYFKIIFGGGSARLFTVEIPDISGFKSTENVTEDGTDINDLAESSLESDPTAKKALGESSYQTGIEIKAVPPGKKIKNIEMLSGGEKALTSLAFLFAIIGSSPPPFVMLDEVDAALDEANSVRFSRIIKQMAAKTQFIIITHNREVMREAQILYGVTMQKDGISRLLSVKLEEAEAFDI